MVCYHVVAVADVVREGLLPHLWDQCRSVVLSYPLCARESAHRDHGLSEAVYIIVDQLLGFSLASQKVEASLY